MGNIRIVKVVLILLLCFTAISCGTYRHVKMVEKAKYAFDDIADGLRQYKLKFGEDPDSFEDLEAQGFFKISNSVKEYWEFSLIGSNPVTSIEAVALKEGVPEEDKVLTFTPRDNRSNFGH